MEHLPLCSHDERLYYRCDCLEAGEPCIYCDCELIREAKHAALDAAREAVRRALGPMDAADPGQHDAALAAIDALRDGAK